MDQMRRLERPVKMWVCIYICVSVYIYIHIQNPNDWYPPAWLEFYYFTDTFRWAKLWKAIKLFFRVHWLCEMYKAPCCSWFGERNSKFVRDLPRDTGDFVAASQEGCTICQLGAGKPWNSFAKFPNRFDSWSSSCLKPQVKYHMLQALKAQPRAAQVCVFCVVRFVGSNSMQWCQPWY